MDTNNRSFSMVLDSVTIAAGSSIVIVPGGDASDDLALAARKGVLLSLDVDGVGDEVLIGSLYDLATVTVDQSNACDGGGYSDPQTAVAEISGVDPKWSQRLNVQDPVTGGISMAVGFAVGVRCPTGLVLVITNADGSSSFTGRLAINATFDVRDPWR